MMEVVIGGSGSGKSRYGEKRIQELGVNMPRYYVATMKIFGEEEKQRVEKHRRQRQGMGYCTLEQEKDLKDTVKKMKQGKGAVLLECVSNLVANEMFDMSTESIKGEKCVEELTKKILSEIAVLNANSHHLVVVTGNVFADGVMYDEMTKDYMKCLAQVNAGLCEMADTGVEVVAGILVWLKGERGK